ncbi:hypothetical protein RI367_007561 [Sorochytrium milnesiophthora]
MDAATINALEQACFRLYNAGTAAERSQADLALQRAFPTFSENAAPVSPQTALSMQIPQLNFTASKPIDGIGQTTTLLRQCSSPYVQMYLTTHLKTLLVNHSAVLSAEDKEELKKFLLSYLRENVSAQPFVISTIGQLLSIIIRVAWFESESVRNLVDDLNPLIMSQSAAEQTVKLQTLATIVYEMSTPSYSILKMNKNRKAVISFRDTQLMRAFQIAAALLDHYHQTPPSPGHDQTDMRRTEAALLLLRNCLCFDFIGTMPDESSDDFGTLQVPGAWKSLFGETFLSQLFGWYRAFPSSIAGNVMECIAYVVSVRRSLFGDKERTVYISAIIEQTASVMAQSAGMDNPSNFHEFCKVLARFKQTYPMTELVDSPHYEHWISLVTAFTIKGFQSWQWSPNSVAYLLMLWSKMASSISSMGGSNSSSSMDSNTVEDDFSQRTYKVVVAYIDSRLGSVESLIRNGEDAFDEEETLTTALELLAPIARRSYPECAEYIASLARQLNKPIETSNSRANEMAQSVYTAWIVYIIATFVGGRVPYQSPESNDTIDGELSCIVLQLLSLTQGPQTSSEPLDSAFLYFFQQFRKSYIADDTQRVSKLYSKLGELVGVSDQQSMFDVILQHIAYSFKNYAGNAVVVNKTLKLFEELSMGYTNLKLVSKAESAKLLLASHGTYEFTFLRQNVRTRTQYYTTVCRLLFAEDVTQTDFQAFMQPFSEKFALLDKLTSPAQYYNDQVKITVAGLCRDLRGLVFAVMSRRNFGMIWDWLFPDRLGLLLRALEVYTSQPDVLVPILKFFDEFCQNRSQRLTVDNCSPNGVLLFREVSKVLCVFAAGLSEASSPANDLYASRYKGIAVCCAILRNAMAGNYVPFGVFGLYGDPALALSYQAAFRMMQAIPEQDLLAYPKLAAALLSLISVITAEQQLPLLSDIDSDVFLRVCRLLGESVKSSNKELVSTAVSTVDNLATFVCKQTMEQTKQSNHVIVQAFVQYPDIFSYWLSSILGIVLLEDSPVQWSLTRPILPLVLLGQNFYEMYISKLAEAQLPERRPQITKLLCSITEDVDMTLVLRSRDRLTNNIAAFRRDISQQGVTLMPLPDVNWSF